jgi:hypothetical protein
MESLHHEELDGRCYPDRCIIDGVRNSNLRNILISYCLRKYCAVVENSGLLLTVELRCVEECCIFLKAPGVLLPLGTAG